MSTLPGGEVASSPSAVGTIGLLDAGRIGELIAERSLAAGHPIRLHTRQADVRQPVQATFRGLKTGRLPGTPESALPQALTAGCGRNAAGRYVVAPQWTRTPRRRCHALARLALTPCRDTPADVCSDLSKLLAAAYDG
ncbi:MAG TPA: hypothetical protein VJT72_10360 [Pseudonocardiaceae bacterium]|nr:hypothetical protein [Pseudonocardiaceae bacterium]